MPSKEHEALVEKVATVLNEQKGCYFQPQDYHRGAAKEVISTILAALQEPNAEMLKALWSANASRGWPEAAKTCWQAVLTASALGEQSDG